MVEAIQIICIALGVYINFTRSKKRLLISNIINHILEIFIGILQDAYSLCACNLVNIYRSCVVVHMNKLSKYKWFPLTFVIPHIALGILLWEDAWSLLTILGPITKGLLYWYSDNLQLYRLVSIITKPLWGIYYFTIGAYLLIAVAVFNLATSVTAFCVNFKKYGFVQNGVSTTKC